MINKIKWYFKKRKILKHMVKHHYNYGLCYSVDQELGGEEYWKFKDWLTLQGYESWKFIYPTRKEYFGKRKELLDEYIKYRIAE